jgi:hypothetical protein
MGILLLEFRVVRKDLDSICPIRVSKNLHAMPNQALRGLSIGTLGCGG